MDVNRITKLRFIEEFRRQRIVLFSINDTKKIFSLENNNTTKHLLIRLRKDRIVERLARDKYQFLLTENPPHEFTVANFLVAPSYISLESALSYYGIIDQFPYRITSITISKQRTLMIKNKQYSYSSIKKGKFKDYIKIDDFLIASKEKAIFDYVYFAFNGLRTLNTLLDIKNHLHNKPIFDYFIKNGDDHLIKFIKKNVKL